MPAAVSQFAVMAGRFVRFVTVPTAMPSSTTFDCAMHSSEMSVASAPALSAVFTEMRCPLATGIGGKIGRYVRVTVLPVLGSMRYWPSTVSAPPAPIISWTDLYVAELTAASSA
jgi:hypothetical protein